MSLPFATTTEGFYPEGASVGNQDMQPVGGAEFPVSGILFDPPQLGFPSNLKMFSIGVAAVALANDCFYTRVMGGGFITKVGLKVAVSSGNISVAAYQSAPNLLGRLAVPGPQIASSGAVACPGVGYAEVALGSRVPVRSGDWLALSVDNATASFLDVDSDPSSLMLGFVRKQNPAHPAPAAPASLVNPTANNVPILIGVP